MALRRSRTITSRGVHVEAQAHVMTKVAQVCRLCCVEQQQRQQLRSKSSSRGAAALSCLARGTLGAMYQQASSALQHKYTPSAWAAAVFQEQLEALSAARASNILQGILEGPHAGR